MSIELGVPVVQGGGVALTLVTPREMKQLRLIEKETGARVNTERVADIGGSGSETTTHMDDTD